MLLIPPACLEECHAPTTGQYLFLALLLAPVTAISAAEPFHYPEAKRGKGELKYIHGLPVLLVRGTPEEIGDQIGVLGRKPFAGLLTQFQDTLKAWGWERMYPLFLKTGNLMLPQFPRDHRRELEAIAKASGVDQDLLAFANTIPVCNNRTARRRAGTLPRLPGLEPRVTLSRLR